MDINTLFSESTKKLITDCRLTAIRYNNDFISLTHFYLVYNRYRKNEYDLEVTISDKKALLKNIIGVNFSGKVEGRIPITKDFERALKFSDFHRWIIDDTLIEPRNIYLAILADEIEYKQSYFEFLNRNNIKLYKLKNFIINTFFNNFIKKAGLRKFYK